MDIIVTTMGDRPFLLHNRDKSATTGYARSRSTKSKPRRLRRESEGDRWRQTYFGEFALRVRLSHAKRPPPALWPGQGDDCGRIEILWPSKQAQELTNVKVDQISRSANPASGNKRERGQAFSNFVIAASLVCWLAPVAANPCRHRRAGSDAIVSDRRRDSASTFWIVVNPPGSRVVLMEAPPGSGRVQVLSEGLPPPVIR